MPSLYLPARSHRAILEPVLEVLTPRLGPAHILAALSGNPLDQDLLQVRIVLLLNLLLHLSAQAVGRSPVGHSDSCGDGEELWEDITRPTVNSTILRVL